MRHLAGTGLVPVPLPRKTGDDITQVDGHFVRLLTWLDGRPMGETARQSDSLLVDLGRSVGLIDSALATFDHPALHRTFQLGSGTRAVGHSATPAACARRLRAPPDRIAHRDLSGNGRASCAVVSSQRDSRRRERLQRAGGGAFPARDGDRGLRRHGRQSHGERPGDRHGLCEPGQARSAGRGRRRGVRISRDPSARRGRNRGAVRPHGHASLPQRLRRRPAAGRTSRPGLPGDQPGADSPHVAGARRNSPAACALSAARGLRPPARPSLASRGRVAPGEYGSHRATSPVTT